MLHRKRAVIANHAESRDKAAPEMPRVTIADGAENPGAIGLIAVMARIKHAVDFRIPFMNRQVFGVDMPDRAFEGPNGGARIDALPEQMRGIEIGADDRPRSFPQFQQRVWVVDDKAGMHLQRNFLNALAFRELRRLPPIRRYHPSPLIFEDLQVIRRPGAGHPIRLFIAWRAAGATAEINHDLDAEPARQAQRLFERSGIS